jgi:hypothetical protein
MAKGFLSSVALLLASAGLVVAQPMPAYLPAGAPLYQPDPAQGIQPVGCASCAAGGGGPAMMGGYPGFPSLDGSGGDGAPVTVRPLYSRNNAFGPKAVHHPEGNAFELAEDHPEDLCDNAWMPSKCCHPFGWASVEFLLWWINKPIPTPLVTTASLNAPLPNAGALGAPGGTTILSGSTNRWQTDPGVRATAGVWIECPNLGFEVSGFYMSQVAQNFQLNSLPSGFPVIARPFFNVATGAQDRELVAFPGNFSGGVVTSYSSLLGGADATFVYNPFKTCGNYPEFLIGFRYLDLEEHLTVDESLRLLASGRAFFNGAAVLPPASLAESDRFHTRDQFFGALLGVRAKYDINCWLDLDIQGKVGLGPTRETVVITGSTTLFPPGGTPLTTNNGGLLALPSNIGQFHRDQFTAIPELTATLGVKVCCWFRVFAGYNLLYWPTIVRAGEQVDPRVNPTIHPTDPAFTGVLTGQAVPAPLFRQTYLLTQGLTAGFKIEF